MRAALGRWTAPKKPAMTAPTSGDSGCGEQEVLRDRHAQPISPSAYPVLATLIDARLRNSTTRMARPIADSAAATVRMKKTNDLAGHEVGFEGQEVREGDEIEVDGQQHQLDGHQQHD